MLVTDGIRSFVMFLYADTLIQWSRIGRAAQVGYDAGDGENYFSHPDAQSTAIINITMTSNVDRAGVWMFRVDGGMVFTGGCISGNEGWLY